MRLSPFIAWVAGLPEDAVPGSARAVLCALAAHADGGRDDPTHADLGALSGHATRTIERHLAALSRPATGAALIAIETGRTAEGWPRNRYRLLAPLTIVAAAETHRLAVNIARGRDIAGEAGIAAARHSDLPAADMAGGPAAILDCHPPDWREAARQYGEPAANVAGGQYKEQARARARPFPSFHPSFSDFSWPSDAMKEQAALVLGACGPGLRPIEADPERMLGSLAQLLAGEWARLDLMRDVIPVVRESTKRTRRNPLADFKLPARDVAAQVGRNAMRGLERPQQRARGEGGVAAKGAHVAAPVGDSQAARLKRTAGLRSIIGIFESGQRPEWTLDAGERALARSDADAAFAQAMERYRAELSAIEAESEGGGDG